MLWDKILKQKQQSMGLLEKFKLSMVQLKSKQEKHSMLISLCGFLSVVT